MAKFYGKLGFYETVEKRPGVWMPVVTERNYYGDVIRNTHRFQSNSDTVNDDIVVSNEISILADPYANGHFYAIKYVEFNGQKWKVTSVDVQFPRLNLTLGGLYSADN